MLQQNRFQIVGYIHVAVVMRFGFGGVEFFAAVDVGVLGVVDDEVLYAQCFGLFGSVFDRHVALFVRFEDVAMVVEAEGFGEEPSRIAGVLLVDGIVAFRHQSIARAEHGEFASIVHVILLQECYFCRQR